MNYDESLEYLNGLSKKGIHPGLEGIEKLLAALDNPEKDLNIIHVAGTNGKGSTCMFLMSVLNKAGYRPGLFQSPKVFDEREIIRVKNRNISKDDFADLVTRISDTNLEFTRFEAETAMALLYFKEKECDPVILEAGMGGLLDATNVSNKALMTIYTAIGMDHMEYLGNSLSKIAENKAGLIKRNSFVISNIQQDNVRAILKAKANAMDALFTSVNPDLINKVKIFREYTTFDYGCLKKLKIAMLGLNQPGNASLVTEAVLKLRELDYKISDKNLYDGLFEAKNPGRFERISEKPVIYLDGAHNVPAAECLVDNIKAYFTKQKIIYIMGMFRDKDAEEVIKLTAPFASHILTVTLPNRERSLTAFELADMVRSVNPMVSSCDSIDEAVEIATMMASETGAYVLCFGSLSHLSRIKDAVSKKKTNYFGVV
jgi:dihydrofolate synthase/folylpolyglutamate synthase